MDDDKLLEAIQREIRKWDGLHSQADLQSAAPAMSRRILAAMKRVGAKETETTEANCSAARGMRWLGA